MKEVKKYYIATNAIIRTESFGGLILLRNGKRYNVSLDKFNILKECNGKSFNEILEKTRTEETSLRNFIDDALSKNIIVDKYNDNPGRIVEVDYIIENSLVFPRFVALEITDKCNLRCKHCYTSSGNTNINELSLNKICRLIDEMSDYGSEFLALGGGEPLIHKDIYEIIRYAISKNVEIELVTNGILLTDSVIAKLEKTGLRYIQVSLDGDCPKTYLDIRGTDCFNLVVDNIRKVNKKFITSVATVICSYNYDSFFNIIKIANDVGVDYFRVLKFIETGRGNENKSELQILPRRFEEFVNLLKKRKNEFDIDIRIDEDMINGFGRKKIPWLKEGFYGCSAGRSTIGIDSKGNVYPCSFLHYPELVCGNIKEESILEIWKASKILKEYRNINDIGGKCNKCEHKANCQGGCRAAAYSSTGDIKGEDTTCYIK